MLHIKTSKDLLPQSEYIFLRIYRTVARQYVYGDAISVHVIIIHAGILSMTGGSRNVPSSDSNGWIPDHCLIHNLYKEIHNLYPMPHGKGDTPIPQIIQCQRSTGCGRCNGNAEKIVMPEGMTPVRTASCTSRGNGSPYWHNPGADRGITFFLTQRRTWRLK